MPPAPPDHVLHAFAETVRNRLMRREEVAIPGLGRLVARHEPSRVTEDAEGRRLLCPPCDVVHFDPDPALRAEHAQP